MNRKSFLLRLEPELYRKVEQQAKCDRRSITKELEHIIAAYMETLSAPASETDKREEEK